MKRTLLMAAACALALVGCKKEDAGTTGGNKGGDGLITEITAAAADMSTKVLCEPNVFIPELDAEGDRLTWAAGDEIAFWELEPITNISNEKGKDSPGYMPKNQKKIIFQLVKGAGTKSGVFAPKTAGEGLDPDGLYVATHCSTPDKIVLATNKTDDGDENMWNRLNFKPSLSYTLKDSDNGDIVSRDLRFISKVNIVDGEVEPLSFQGINAVMEFQLWQDESSLKGDYTVTKIELKNPKKNGKSFYYFYYQYECNFNPDRELNIKSGGANNYNTLNIEADIALSKDEANPTIVRMPFFPRQNPGNGNYAGGGEVSMDVIFTLKNESGVTTTKTFAGLKKGKPDSQNVVFPGGQTYYRVFKLE